MKNENSIFISIILFLILSILSIPIFGQEIKFTSIENNFCKPLKYDQDLKLNYETYSCGTVSGFIKGKYDDFELFKDKKEYFGAGKIFISTNTINKWMDEYSFRGLCQISLLLTHVSCRNNRYSQDITPLKLEISAPYGYKLLEYPTKPELLRTDLKLKIEKVNPVSFLYFVLGVGLSVGGISYAIENDLFGTGGDNVAITTGLLLGGGIGFISLGANNYYKYKYIPDTTQNYENNRENDYQLTNWRHNCQRTDKRNKLIKNTFTVKIML